jgi:hypothetical protein
MATKALTCFLLPEVPEGRFVVQGYEEGALVSQNGHEYIPMSVVFETTEDLAEAWSRADQLIAGHVSDHKLRPVERVAYFRAGSLEENEGGQIGFQPNDQPIRRGIIGGGGLRIRRVNDKPAESAPVDIDDSDVRNSELDEFMEQDIGTIGLPHYVEHSLRGLGSRVRDLYSESESTIRAVIQVESVETDRAVEKIRKFFQDNQIIGYDAWPKR